MVAQQHLFGVRNEEIFKCLSGKSRGVELHKKNFDKIIKKALFHTIIKFKTLNCESFDPIAKRVSYLKSFQK